MKTLTIKRDDDNGERCFGVATFLEHTWASLELPWKDNYPEVSCIPTGTYTAEIYDSDKHGRVYLLKGIPGRSLVEIHAANWAHELLGCIALGRARGMLNGEDAILISRPTIEDFMASAGGEPITVVIE